MSYPIDHDIENESSNTGYDQIVIYAYAAVHASLPSGGDAHSVLGTFQTLMQTNANTMGVTENLLEGYVQEHGTIPSTGSQVTSWAHGENFLDSAGNIQQSVPPGHNYPPGSSTAPPTSSTSSTTASTNPSPSSAFGFLTNPVNIGGFQVSPIALGVGGVAALLILPDLLGGRRR